MGRLDDISHWGMDCIGDIAESGGHRGLRTVVDVEQVGQRTHDAGDAIGGCTEVRPRITTSQAQFESLDAGDDGGTLALQGRLARAQVLDLGVGACKR